jgi:hypothetical protein
MRQDQRSQADYEMILSDFVIGNNNNPILMDTTTISTADITMSPPAKKTITPKKKLFIKKKLPVSTAL